MPLSAPLPVPTMIAVGVARPIAHGQAMMRTAIAVDSANGRLGDGPKRSQVAKVSAATAMTAGTNHPVTRSASRWIGAFEPCARSTRLTIWARVVSGPTRSARITNDPLVLSVAPITPSPARLVDRDRLAGEHRLVHRGRAVDDDAIDGKPIAGPHPQQVTDDDLADGHVAVATRAQDACCRRPQLEKAAHGTRGLSLGACLEPPPEQAIR